MKQIIIPFAIAVAAMVACTTDFEEQVSENGPQIIITATNVSPETTRTTVQDGGTQVLWEPSDEIAVFYNGVGGYFVSQNTEPAASAEFAGTLNAIFGFNEGTAAENPIWGLYPYREDASSNKVSVTTTLPAEQVGRAGSFAKNTQITLARANSLNLGFYNVTGGLRFSLTQQGIKKVTFEGVNGETLAGTIKLAFADGVPAVQEITNGVAKITLSAPEGETFQTGQWYYLAAIPGPLANGFKMTFYKDSEFAELTSNKSVSFKRGVFGSLANVDEGLTFEAEAIEVEENTTKEVSDEGGEVTLEFFSNVPCHAVIPVAAQSWISVVPETKAMIRQTIGLIIQPNTGAARSATVTVQSEDGSLVLSFTIEQKAKWIDVTSISLNLTSAQITIGGTITLTATVNPNDATDKTVTWSTSDESVAFVSGGVVTGKKIGTAIITAGAGDKMATCEITVTPSGNHEGFTEEEW